MSIKITTKVLPKGTVGEPYSCQLAAEVIPKSNIIWRAISELPYALSLDPESGFISGICEEVFKETIGIEAESVTENEKTEKSLALVITESEPANPPLEIITEELPTGSVGEPYTATLMAEGGVPPYHWIARNLPVHLSLIDNEITGTPLKSGNNIICFTVNDSALTPAFQYKGFTLEVVDLRPIINSFEANWISDDSNNLELVWDVEDADDLRIQQLPSATISGERLIITPTAKDHLLSRYTLVATNGHGSITSTIEVMSLENVGNPVEVGNSPRPLAESHEASTVFVGLTSGERGFVALNDKTLSPLPSSPFYEIVVWSIVVSPDGLRVFVGAQGAGVGVYNALTLEKDPNSPVSSGGLWQLALSPNGSLLYVVSQMQPDNSKSILEVFRTDTVTFEKTNEIELDYTPASIAISPNGERVYLPNQIYSNTVTVLSSDTLEPVSESPILEVENPRSVGFSHDGGLVYIVNSATDSSITIVDAKTLKPTKRSPVLLAPLGTSRYPAYPNALAVSPDGLRIYTTNTNTVSITVLSTETLDGLTVPTLTRPKEICASRDGSRIYVTNTEGNTLSVLRPLYGLLGASPLA